MGWISKVNNVAEVTAVTQIYSGNSLTSTGGFNYDGNYVGRRSGTLICLSCLGHCNWSDSDSIYEKIDIGVCK